MTIMKHNKKQESNTSKGFSLIELIVMIALLGLLAAIASTRIKDISVNVRISSAINQITSDIDLVKEIALAKHEPMSITYNESLNICTIKKNGTIMADYPGSNEGIINLSEGTFLGVDISQVNINGSNIINIDKWGNVLNNGTITLTEKGNTTLDNNHIISIDKLTGFTEVTSQ